MALFQWEVGVGEIGHGVVKISKQRMGGAAGEIGARIGTTLDGNGQRLNGVLEPAFAEAREALGVIGPELGIALRPRGLGEGWSHCEEESDQEGPRGNMARRFHRLLRVSCITTARNSLFTEPRRKRAERGAGAGE